MSALDDGTIYRYHVIPISVAMILINLMDIRTI